MGFLFPLFLLAGVLLLLPLVIHLFNLRRYKHEYFPDIRFLRQVQLVSKRSRELKKKWLLLSRLLFVAALVIAFAQPYWNSAKTETKNAIKVIYLDNSYSMSVQSGPESLLQQAKNRVEDLVRSAAADTRFLVLTNDRLSVTRPMQRKAALDAIRSVTWSAKQVTLDHILGSIAQAQDNEPNESWQVYLFSDFQQSTLNPYQTQAFSEKLLHTSFYLYPIQNPEVSNLYIDSAFLLHSTAGQEQQNELITRIKSSGKRKEVQNTIQIAIDGQVRGVKSIQGIKDSIRTDTIPLQFNTSAWQKITISLHQDLLPFDDTFRLVAHTGTGLHVLLISEEPVNPYLQNAFANMPGINVQQQRLDKADTGYWGEYSLIVLQNLDYFTPGLEKKLEAAMAKGQNVLLFPGKDADKQRLNQSMKKFADIRFSFLDTAAQQVASLQKAHPLVNGVFEKVPENIQLPFVIKRFPIYSGITANQQAVLSFRDGTPFLAQYRFDAGSLFLCAAPLDNHYSDFPLSYFFVPLLYKMAAGEGTANNFSVAIGSDIPVHISNADHAGAQRGTWHLMRPGFDAVAASQAAGGGTSVFAGKAADQPGFYLLKQEGHTDSTFVAVNIDNKESRLTYADQSTMEKALKGYKTYWLNEDHIRRKGWDEGHAPFPLWKIAICIALICLLAETWLLVRQPRASKVQS